MAVNVREAIEVLQVRSRGIAEELYEIREKFKIVRDRREIPPEKYDLYQSHFTQTVQDLCQLARSCEKIHIGTNTETVKKNQREEDLTARYEKKIEDLRNELLLERKAKEEALTRVSALASQFLKAGNPNITDISDRNRPTRLAEDFKTIYDDEWTDAFEYLTVDKKFEENEAISTLYDLLKVCHDISKEGLELQYKQLEEMVTAPSIFKMKKSDSNNSSQSSRPLMTGSPQLPSRPQKQQNFSKTVGSKPDQTFRQELLGKDTVEDKSDILHLESELMEFRKTIVLDMLNSVSSQEIKEAVHKRFPAQEDILKSENVLKYLEKCVKLCWLMKVQYPPMEVDFYHNKGDPFKTNLFKVYLNGGAKIAFVVWPPLYLHHNGPIAGIGYAEGDGNK